MSVLEKIKLKLCIFQITSFSQTFSTPIYLGLLKTEDDHQTWPKWCLSWSNQINYNLISICIRFACVRKYRSCKSAAFPSLFGSAYMDCTNDLKACVQTCEIWCFLRILLRWCWLRYTKSLNVNIIICKLYIFRSLASNTFPADKSENALSGALCNQSNSFFIQEIAITRCLVLQVKLSVVWSDCFAMS
jgi:hypothetical protein